MQTCELSFGELRAVAGGEPNLGGYIYCNVPGTPEGLYVGSCPAPQPQPSTTDKIINIIKHFFW